MQCINPECTRSTFGSSKFDLRTSTWYDRLFEHVPRMDQADPRFKEFSAKKFLAFNPSIEVNSRSWVDPRDVEAQADQVQAAPVPVEPKPAVQVQEVVQPELRPIEQSVQHTTSPAPTPAQTGTFPQHLVLANTPVQRGLMIQAPVGAPRPVSSWEAPVPSADTEGVKVVKPGTKIKLG